MGINYYTDRFDDEFKPLALPEPAGEMAEIPAIGGRALMTMPMPTPYRYAYVEPYADLRSVVYPAYY